MGSFLRVEFHAEIKWFCASSYFRFHTSVENSWSWWEKVVNLISVNVAILFPVWNVDTVTLAEKSLRVRQIWGALLAAANATIPNSHFRKSASEENSLDQRNCSNFYTSSPRSTDPRRTEHRGKRRSCARPEAGRDQLAALLIAWRQQRRRQSESQRDHKARIFGRDLDRHIDEKIIWSAFVCEGKRRGWINRSGPGRLGRAFPLIFRWSKIRVRN